MNLSLVIPVYNEGEAILSALEAIENQVRTPHQVYLVYDFPEDNSVPFALRWQQQHSNLHLVRNDLGPGPANALRVGLASVPPGAAVVVMADASDQVEQIDAMYGLLQQGHDIVVGSRYMKGGEQRGGPWAKSFLSRLAGLSLHWLTGIPTHDTTNSFKMYRTDLVAATRLESAVGFAISMEITVKAFVQGSSITEIPTIWTERRTGKSRFQVFHWLPQYLHWYFFALLRRNRLHRLLYRLASTGQKITR